MNETPNIYAGLKVIDLATYIAGPAATTILADFGADVIKVEPPSGGDAYRHFFQTPPNPTCGVNYAWQLTNRNKRSIALDLKSPASRQVIERLVRWADVLVTNYPPHVKQALGVDHATLSPLNPRLVYADITGYGSHGPDADTPGFDVTAYWARTGHMQVTHDAGSPPTLPIPGIGDHATATALYAAIATALYLRERTGEGRYVSTSLIANGIWAAATWVEGGLNGARFFPQHDRTTPPNALLNPYRTADDRWFLLVAAQTKDWPGFVHAIDRPDLIGDPRFADPQARARNAAALVSILDPLFEAEPLDHWKDVLTRGHVIHSVSQVAHEIVADPQLEANGIVVPLTAAGEGRRTVSNPLTIGGFDKEPPTLAPALDADGDAILRELGFEPAEIDAIRRQPADRPI